MYIASGAVKNVSKGGKEYLLCKKVVQVDSAIDIIKLSLYLLKRFL